MVTLSIELVGDPSNGNLWSVLGTVTPAATMVNEYYVKFYINNIFYRTERGAPYTMFGDNGIDITLSRLATDGIYQIKVEAWDTTQTILHDTKTITVTQSQVTLTFTRTIKVVQGNGIVNVYKNGTFVGTATPISQYILTANIGDSYSVTGVPATGYVFEKVCTDITNLPCTTDITSGTTFNTTHIISHTKEYYFIPICQTPVCNFSIA